MHTKALALALISTLATLTACVGNKMYNPEPEQYLQTLVSDDGIHTYDLAIIEFDDEGMWWDRQQLEDTAALLQQRSDEHPDGLFVITFVHGWKNNADPNREGNDLQDFRADLARTAARLADDPDQNQPDRVVGVYLGWRGATSGVVLHNQTTFWDRRQAAERTANYHMRETLFRIIGNANHNRNSKVFIVGHSMGGIVVGKTLGPALATLLLASENEGIAMTSDLVLLANPALDALSSWQLIEFLKRNNARVELRDAEGNRFPAPGPAIVSITSEADTATRNAYRFGRVISNLFTPYRTDHAEGEPSQRRLATTAEGHLDYIISHRAFLDDEGELVLERVEDAYNDTPFWIIQVTGDIVADHNDLRNPNFGKLVGQISDLNSLFRSDFQTWIVTGDEKE